MAEPVPLILTALKHFDLGAGESIGTAFGAVRIGARLASGNGMDHRTVTTDAQYGDLCVFGLTKGIPTLSIETGATYGNFSVSNGLDGPTAGAISVTVHHNNGVRLS